MADIPDDVKSKIVSLAEREKVKANEIAGEIKKVRMTNISPSGKMIVELMK